VCSIQLMHLSQTNMLAGTTVALPDNAVVRLLTLCCANAMPQATHVSHRCDVSTSADAFVKACCTATLVANAMGNSMTSASLSEMLTGLASFWQHVTAALQASQAGTTCTPYLVTWFVWHPHLASLLIQHCQHRHRQVHCILPLFVG
jgi:hypothetical protein